MEQGKVSVVLTCYKYAHFLPYALDSVLAQTYGDVEAIVVNDGSPDNTDEVMQRYLADPRVVYIKQENGGQAVAKNTGIRAARGEFVAFLDADDIWDPRKLEKQMPLFADARVGVTYTGMSFIDEAGKPVAHEFSALSKPRAGRITEHLFVDNIVPFSSSVVRRSCFDEVGVMDTSFRMAIDWDLWLRMSVRYDFAFVDEPLLRYRMGHSGQMSKNIFVREKDTMRIMEQFLAAHPGLLPQRLIDWVMAYSCCNRGYYYRSVDGWHSLSWYLRAIRWRWNHGTAYWGLFKLAASKTLAPLGIRR